MTRPAAPSRAHVAALYLAYLHADREAVAYCLDGHNLFALLEETVCWAIEAMTAEVGAEELERRLQAFLLEAAAAE